MGFEFHPGAIYWSPKGTKVAIVTHREDVLSILDVEKWTLSAHEMDAEIEWCDWHADDARLRAVAARRHPPHR